jgi:ATP-binding cassette subfamily C (CFTR/MRP) protein 1
MGGQTNCVFFFALQIGLLARWSRPAAFRTRLSVATAIVAIVDAIAIAILSTLDHNRSARPSTVLQIYLTLSMLFDIVRTRTIWLISSDHALVILFTAAAASKAVMLFLELTEKRHALEPRYRSLPREATSGFANVSIFWWLNRILRLGAGKIIGLQELDGLENEFDSVRLLERLQSDWLSGRR